MTGIVKRRTRTERREAMLAAAQMLFLEQGYNGTNLDSIIEMAGGSKRDIYTEFGNKEGLFIAIIDKVSRETVIDIQENFAVEKCLRESLIDIGNTLLGFLLSPFGIAAYNIVASECHAFPEMARRFYETGPNNAIKAVAGILQTARARGDFIEVDVFQAAEYFLSMLRGNLHMQVAFGLVSSPNEQEIKRLVASATDFFLRSIEMRKKSA